MSIRRYHVRRGGRVESWQAARIDRMGHGWSRRVTPRRDSAASYAIPAALRLAPKSCFHARRCGTLSHAPEGQNRPRNVLPGGSRTGSCVSNNKSGRDLNSGDRRSPSPGSNHPTMVDTGHTRALCLSSTHATGRLLGRRDPFGTPRSGESRACSLHTHASAPDPTDRRVLTRHWSEHGAGP